MKVSIKVSALVARGRSLLLIKEWSKKRRGFFWNVIKGTFNEVKDKNLIDTVIRETLEEVSLPVRVMSLFSIFVLKRKGETIMQFNFNCRPLNNSFNNTLNKPPKLRASYEKDERISEFRWFSRKDFEALSRRDLFSKRTEDILIDFFSNKKAVSLDILKNIKE